MLSCRLFGHRWRTERRATDEGMARASVFTVRICRRCQLIQIQGSGPIGDGKWHPIAPFPGSLWEVERFAAASSEHYNNLYGGK